MESLKLSICIPEPIETVFHAWLDSKQHSRFTGSEAEVDPKVGGEFTAWGGYISGKTKVLEPPNRILQSWRTTEFPVDSPDSLLEILLEKIPGGTQLTLIHTEIPDGQAEMYREGWEEYYFTPMQDYFQQC
ncbi:MAG: Activator of Hsp90 ATPase 1 family protein [Chloroflexi bacterium]|nr:MAG: Activator of Hsp90 ATPase 1 family protein [Chloroflexota bacterium]MBA4376660.1 hypothetical protein [Anaerolinea sp.]